MVTFDENFRYLAKDQAMKAELLAEAQARLTLRTSDLIAAIDRAEKAETAFAVEQAQVFAALQERDDLAVALAEARAERDEADRDCSLIIGWAAAADGEPDVMLNEFHALRARIAELEKEQDEFVAVLSFDGQQEFSATVHRAMAAYHSRMAEKLDGNPKALEAQADKRD